MAPLGRRDPQLERVMEERPDMILLAGDYIQEHDLNRRNLLYRQLNDLLQTIELKAPLGVFAVQGNVDAPGWPEIFAGLPVRCAVDTETIDAGVLQVTGLSMSDSFRRDLSVSGNDKFHIVLGHAPDFALGRIEADLLLAGHTHGGQVQLPLIGPLITLSRVPRSWAAGVTQLDGGRTLIVSRGIGMERGQAPRLRFLCRPQLVVIELTPEE